MSGIDYLKFKQLIHSDDLYHHGIKGQKWGVRKKVYEQDYDRMTPDEKMKYMDDQAKQAKKHSRRVRLMLAAGAIVTYALIRQYKNNRAKATTEVVEEKAKEVVKEKVKEQTKEKVKEQAKEKVKEQAKAQVTNSAANVGQTAVNKILKDGSSNLARIPSMAIRGDKIKPFIFYHSLDNQDDYLEHFGILGQKWGVRRFQNEDGTLTPEGKERYYKKYLSSINNPGAAVFDARDAYNNMPDELKKHINKLSDIDDRINENSKNLIDLDEKLWTTTVPDYKENADSQEKQFELYRKELKNIYTNAIKDKKVKESIEQFNKLYNERDNTLKEFAQAALPPSKFRTSNGFMAPNFDRIFNRMKLAAELINYENRDRLNKDSIYSNMIASNFEAGLVPDEYLDKIDEWYKIQAFD